MGRAPCCEKMGLKKGPWTSEEDRILVSYIHKYGHANWRALPKKAGLLRCGKSCRLRWMNYLRPDIKRGNFTKEDEDTIIALHESLGNRWSAIAAQLPGRTDNEIKNVWHTHLKKRLFRQNHHTITTRQTKHSITSPKCDQVSINGDSECQNSSLSSEQASLATNTAATTNTETNNIFDETIMWQNLDYAMTFPVIEESSGSLESENSSMTAGFFVGLEKYFAFNYSNVVDTCHANEVSYVDDGGMDFWYSLSIDAEGIQGLL